MYKVGDIFNEFKREVSEWCNNNNCYLYAEIKDGLKCYAIKENEISNESIEQERVLNIIATKKQRLNQLSQDFIQAFAGEVVPNLDERKEEFIKIHNEIRELEGKPPRELQDTLIDN